MAGVVSQRKPSRYKPMRDHDYLFDSTFAVAGEKDHNKVISKAAIATAQMTVVPIFEHMFSDLRTYPNTRRVYIPNAHLPSHINLSYSVRTCDDIRLSSAMICGKERFKFYATPKAMISLIPMDQPLNAASQSSPEQFSPKGIFVDKCVQTLYREEYTQTDPYQPEFIIKEGCKTLPEVLLLENVQIDFHDIKSGVDKSMVQWVNRQWAKKAWLDVEPTTSILKQLEYCEQKHREMDIDYFLSQIESPKHIPNIMSKIDSGKPDRLWICRMDKLEKSFDKIRKTKERDLRKLEAKRMERESNEKSSILKYHFAEKLSNISLNSTFLPTIEKLENNIRIPSKNCDSINICTKFNKLDDKRLEELQKLNEN
ncbi:cilia- and flagella-associated protein 91-like [Arctopsyche grandis]|uniref:cilia- and flagella-associated protein 91-like n=1 Tax=Arctopsyche grandis TaxID=121162 RepID=UPI00406D9FBD